MNKSTSLWECYVCLAVCVITFVMPFTSQASRHSIVHTEDFDIGDFTIDNVVSPSGDTYTKISWANTFNTGEVGQPELLVRYLRFLVPDNACDFSVNIVEASLNRHINLEYPLYPVQDNKPMDKASPDDFTPPNPDIYTSFKSNVSASVVEESWLEGKYHILTVAVCPSAYSADVNTLDLFGSINLSVSYGENGERLTKAPAVNSDTGSIIDISKIVVNPEISEKGLEKAVSPNPNGEIIPTYYYIISERKLLPSLERLADWKRQKGYKVVTTAIEDIYSDTKYKVGTASGIVDEAASLRSWLSDEFSLRGSFFCLLVGDHKTKMPVRKLRDSTVSSPANIIPNSDNYIPTDNYFSDLTGNGWSVFKDDSGQYVCDLKATKYQPSIYVGRLLCHTNEQISNYVSKLILYESNPGRGNSSYLDKTTLTVQYDGRNYYQGTLSAMQSYFQNVDLMKDVIIDDETKSRYPTGEMMLQAINRSGYSSLMGHGEPGTIACSGKSNESWRWQYISAMDSYANISETEGETTIKSHCDGNGIDLMTNYDSPSVIYSIGCTTSPFDLYEKVLDEGIFKYDLPHTIPSSYTVGGRYGGVAFLGNTRNGYWPTSPKLEQLFLESIKKYPKTGIAEAISKYSFLSHNFVRHAHNLIGDPEFELWRKSPAELNVNINWHDSNITFSGADLNGCRIILNDGEGNIRVVDCKNLSPVLYYLSDDGRMEAVSVIKTGFLPIVSLKCQNQCLNGVEKSFVVRTAEIGTDVDSGMTSGSVEITSKSNIDIHAVDNIRCGDGLSIWKDSRLSLSCDNDIVVKGCNVYSGGSMEMDAGRVVLSNGFSVAKGGSLKIGKN